MKKKFLVGIIIGFFSLSLMACGDEDEIIEDSVQTSESADIEEEIVEETVDALEESLVNYYEANEAINLYLNNYNTANPDALIESSMFEVYHHHGKDHDDQIIMYRDGFEIVMSDILDFEIVIDGEDGEIEAYKEIFKQYAKGYNLELTDEMLDTYWQQVLEDTINCVEFAEFECDLTIYNDQIEYMKLSGELK